MAVSLVEQYGTLWMLLLWDGLGCLAPCYERFFYGMVCSISLPGMIWGAVNGSLIGLSGVL